MIESKIGASICYLFSFHWLSHISFLEVNRRWSYTNYILYTNRVDVTLPAQSNRVWAGVLDSAYVNASTASTRRRHVREREASVTKTTAHRASIQPWPLNFQLGNFLSDGDFKASNTSSINVSLIKVLKEKIDAIFFLVFFRFPPISDAPLCEIGQWRRLCRQVDCTVCLRRMEQLRGLALSPTHVFVDRLLGQHSRGFLFIFKNDWKEGVVKFNNEKKE